MKVDTVNWVTVSSLATAFGTLVLAIATFSAIRSANRSARTGKGVAEIRDDVIYLAMPVRNAGTGIAVLHGWDPRPTWNDPTAMHADPSEFRMLSRDIYIAADDTGFWQGAIRESDDPDREGLHQAVERRTRILIDVMYGDAEGGQRTISRFSLVSAEKEGLTWACSVSRHWNVDRDDPR